MFWGWRFVTDCTRQLSPGRPLRRFFPHLSGNCVVEGVSYNRTWSFTAINCSGARKPAKAKSRGCPLHGSGQTHSDDCSFHELYYSTQRLRERRTATANGFFTTDDTDSTDWLRQTAITADKTDIDNGERRTANGVRVACWTLGPVRSACWRMQAFQQALSRKR